jgi:hypothetical protein
MTAAIDRELLIEQALGRSPRGELRPYRFERTEDAPASSGASPAKCCDRAVRIKCVCALATECPEHGEQHTGTHD